MLVAFATQSRQSLTVHLIAKWGSNQVLSCPAVTLLVVRLQTLLDRLGELELETLELRAKVIAHFLAVLVTDSFVLQAMRSMSWEPVTACHETAA